MGVPMQQPCQMAEPPLPSGPPPTLCSLTGPWADEPALGAQRAYQNGSFDTFWLCIIPIKWPSALARRSAIFLSWTVATPAIDTASL